jgi:O-glycosyl hydrolase
LEHYDMGGTPGTANAAPMGVVIDPSLASEVIAVDPHSTYQTFEGFGTSLCWFGNVVGSWADARRQEVADLLFDDAEGLGLNVVRYNRRR